MEKTTEHIMGDQWVTITVSLTPVDDEELIKKAIEIHHPTLDTPEVYDAVLRKARELLPPLLARVKDEAIEKAVEYAVTEVRTMVVQSLDTLIHAEISRHYLTIAPSDYHRLSEKAQKIYASLGGDKTPMERASQAVIGAIAIETWPGILITGVIYEKWKNLLSTTEELNLIYRARELFSDFSGTDTDKAVKAVSHAHKELFPQYQKSHHN